MARDLAFHARSAIGGWRLFQHGAAFLTLQGACLAEQSQITSSAVDLRNAAFHFFIVLTRIFLLKRRLCRGTWARFFGGASDDKQGGEEGECERR